MGTSADLIFEGKSLVSKLIEIKDQSLATLIDNDSNSMPCSSSLMHNEQANPFQMENSWKGFFSH